MAKGEMMVERAQRGDQEGSNHVLDEVQLLIVECEGLG